MDKDQTTAMTALAGVGLLLYGTTWTVYSILEKRDRGNSISKAIAKCEPWVLVSVGSLGFFGELIHSGGSFSKPIEDSLNKLQPILANSNNLRYLSMYLGFLIAGSLKLHTWGSSVNWGKWSLVLAFALQSALFYLSSEHTTYTLTSRIRVLDAIPALGISIAIAYENTLIKAMWLTLQGTWFIQLARISNSGYEEITNSEDYVTSVFTLHLWAVFTASLLVFLASTSKMAKKYTTQEDMENIPLTPSRLV